MARRKDILGRRGENEAARALAAAGYRILERNWRAKTPGGGELDIVALDGDVLVFVEVKTRTSEEEGHPFEAITSSKRRRIARAAQAYMAENEVEERDCRFDVVGVMPNPDGTLECEILRDAFGMGAERWG